MAARVRFIESEFAITETDPNVTVNDVNTGVEGVAVEYKCPRKQVILIRPSDILAFYGKDNGTTPTEIPAGNVEKLRQTDPNEIVKNDLYTGQYEFTKEFRDRDTVYRVGLMKKIESDQKLQLLLKPTALSTGATKADKTTYRFRLTCRRIAEIIPL